MDNDTSEPDISNGQGAVKSSPTIAPARADVSSVRPQGSSMVDESTNYIVAAGDNLAKIARHYYGDTNAWKAIFDANRDQLSDPDRIKPGQILRIPAKS